MIGFRATAKALTTIVSVGAVLAAFANPARAEIVLSLTGEVPSAGNFTYSYSVLFTGAPGDSIQAGTAQVTGYDLAGLIPASATFTPTNVIDTFNLTVQNIGLTPGAVMPIDDPSIPNISLSYTGTTQTIPGSGLPISLGTLSFTSSVGSTGMSPRGQTSQNNDGGLVQSVRPFTGPEIVPEPASLAVWGTLGLGGLWYARRRLRSNPVAA